MNNHCWGRVFFFLVLLGAMFGGEVQASTPKGGARLIVQRAPNFGTNLFVRLSIDGKRVADIPWNQHYGGTISAGRHVLSVLALPNTASRRPTSMRLTVKSGRAYVFTATWQQDRLVLQPSDTYSPTTAVPAVR
jgi:hypothetical protein